MKCFSILLSFVFVYFTGSETEAQRIISWPAGNASFFLPTPDPTPGGSGGGLAAQSCWTLCNLVDYNLPGSSVHRIFQARILEWAAICFSRVTSQPRDRTRISCVQADSLPTEPPGKH